MIATFFIEVAFLLYILFNRKMSRVTQLIVALLSCLAIFQLAEYSICESLGLNSNIWAKIGFAAITFLPVLGLHLVYTVAGKRPTTLVWVSYLIAVIWVVLFMFGPVLGRSICSGNYVIFTIPDRYEFPYYVYYDVLMMVAVVQALLYASRMKIAKIRTALYALAAGYLSFIIPSMVFGYLDAHGGADSNLPSVMCGFAVIFAGFLTLRVAPLTTKKK